MSQAECDNVIAHLADEASWAEMDERHMRWARCARRFAMQLTLVRQMAAEAAELEDGLSMTMRGTVRVSADEKRRDALRAIAAVIQ